MSQLCTLKKGEFPMLCKPIRRFGGICARLIGAALISVSIAHRTFAQERGTYRSDVDDLLTVEKVSVLPFTDNLQGIYARPLEAHFIQLVDQMHRWDYLPANSSGPILSPEELELSPDKVKQVSAGLNADAFFAARVTKGPNGVTIHLSLFLTKDGKLLSQAVLKDYKQFDISDLKEQTQRLLSEIVTRLPYAGRVLSREGNRVTVNLGTRDGLQVGQMLSVIQILQAQRHPKFNFLIRTEKEIFGKIKILKVDDTLSFGMVATEKEKGAIQKNAKIGPLDFVTYPVGDSLSLTPSPEETLLQHEDGKIAFGKDAKAWKPGLQPSFGQVGGRIGLGRFAQNSTISGYGGAETTDNMSPSIAVEGELWITQEWTFHAGLKQGLISFSNPRSGSSPSKLNQSMSEYEAGFGYMIRFGPYIWSPNLEPFLKYFTYKTYADTASPEVFNTMEYSGLKLGLRGTSPVSDRYGVGGEFSLAWKPSLRESPYDSGSSTNNVTQFAVFGYKKLGERLKAQLQLEFDMYASTFSGGGTRTDDAESTSQRATTLSAGLYYLF
jgi:hypothetical protein